MKNSSKEPSSLRESIELLTKNDKNLTTGGEEDQTQKTKKKSCLEKLKEIHVALKILVILIVIILILSPFIPKIIARTQGTINSATTTKKCDAYIMVILPILSDSYIINGDGSQRSGVKLTTPNNLDNYAKLAQSAVVTGQLYLFGGESDFRKIARLDGCAIVELTVKLNKNFYWGHAALATENGSKALICFGSHTNEMNYCDVFDGTTVVATFSSSFSHQDVGLAYFNGKPTTVGCRYSNGFKKVETLGEDGWTSLVDFPKNYRGHDLVGLSNGDMLLIGGQGSRFSDEIWKLSSATGWTLTGNLNKAMAFGSAIIKGNSIYSFGGRNDRSSSYPIQRLDVTEDGTIVKIELIGNQTSAYEYPILVFSDIYACSIN